MVTTGEIHSAQNLYHLIGARNVAFATACGILNTAFLIAAILMGIGFQERAVSVALVILAMCVGVPVGLILTPMDDSGEKEREIFSTIGKAITTFFSGWLLAKVDATAISIFAYDHLDSLHSFRIISVVSVFLLSATPTYVIRRYGDWSAFGKEASKDGLPPSDTRPAA